MVRGDASKPLRHSLTQQGAISQRLEELTEVGCGGEVRRE